MNRRRSDESSDDDRFLADWIETERAPEIDPDRTWQTIEPDVRSILSTYRGERANTPAERAGAPLALAVSAAILAIFAALLSAPALLDGRPPDREVDALSALPSAPQTAAPAASLLEDLDGTDRSPANRRRSAASELSGVLASLDAALHDVESRIERAPDHTPLLRYRDDVRRHRQRIERQARTFSVRESR